MKINFLNLKELAGILDPPKQPANSAANPRSNPPEISENRLTAAGYLTEYAIQEMFALHMRASKTLWDRKMFDDEFKREGSGFIICYSEGGPKKLTVQDGRGRGRVTASDIYPGIKLDMQSQIIGFFIFYNVIDEMHILDITVAKEMQSKGIGALMLDYVLKIYKSLNIKYFFLEVRASNKIAVNLYKKFGFKIFMLRKNYYEDNGEDALCMVKEL
ncbi:MAG: ribosomal protein S18-alanine N-acetyltransferase [bacterium]